MPMVSIGPFNLVALLGPKGQVFPKWTGRLHATVLAMTCRARVRPCLGCFAVARRLRACAFVVVPQGCAGPLVVAPQVVARACARPLAAVFRLQVRA